VAHSRNEQLIEGNTQSFEEAEKKTEEKDKPDPATQLVTAFSRATDTEHVGAIKEDNLYMDYAFIFSQSCDGAEEEEGGEEEGPSIHEQEMEKQLLFEQARLKQRGVAEMVLLYISAFRELSLHHFEDFEIRYSKHSYSSSVSSIKPIINIKLYLG